MRLTLMVRRFRKAFAFFLVAFAVAGCDAKASDGYRWKLTLAMNTPDGVKRASSVSQISFFDVSIPARGVMHRVIGEALYLDLGPNGRPLVVLMTNTLHGPYDKELMRLDSEGLRWSDETGPSLQLLLRIYGMTSSPGRDTDFRVDVRRLAPMRGAHAIAASDLPDLVTFADIGDPATVMKVDPNDPEATLGKGVSWNEITLEMTDEPMTTDIVSSLPWLLKYRDKNLNLDGTKYQTRRDDPANRLKTWNFLQG